MITGAEEVPDRPLAGVNGCGGGFQPALTAISSAAQAIDVHMAPSLCQDWPRHRRPPAGSGINAMSPAAQFTPGGFR